MKNSAFTEHDAFDPRNFENHQPSGQKTLDIIIGVVLIVGVGILVYKVVKLETKVTFLSKKQVDPKDKSDNTK